MSKPIDLMTKEELIYALGDILERETDGWGNCRWCREPEQLAADAEEYHILHKPDCAVTYIEALLGGTYEYVNDPQGG